LDNLVEVGRRTLLLLLGALVCHAAGNVAQEGIALADAGHINATVLRN
jgi:hypothetical protein